MPRPAFWEITKVEPLQGYVLRLTFGDGTEGEIDMAPRIHGRLFEPLRRDIEFFRSVYVDFGGAIAWSENIDYAPDALYDDMQVILRGEPDPYVRNEAS